MTEKNFICANFVLTPKPNLGDAMCSPRSYFKGLRSQSIHMDWSEVESRLEEWSGRTLVYGGGGMLYRGVMDSLFRVTQRVRSLNIRLVAWGLGVNMHEQKELIHPKFLDEWDLVGLRDFGNPWRYVPCVSCLHPQFGLDRPAPRHEVVLFEHMHAPIQIEALREAPRMTNQRTGDQFESTLEFLASGETVLTNSFHGAYWALLLGCRVKLFKPFSNRFFSFPHVLPCVDESNWRQVSGKREKFFLEECRSLNRAYWKDLWAPEESRD